MFLNDYVDVPYDALTYLTGECNYGGRVTDDKDRRLLNSLLSTFYVPETVKTPLSVLPLTQQMNIQVLNFRYSFSPSGLYYVPKDTSYEAVVSYIKSLPITPQPEVFGLHENADITKDNQETQIVPITVFLLVVVTDFLSWLQLLQGVLLTQTQLTRGSGGEEGQDQAVIDLAEDILSKVPDTYDVEDVSKKYPVMYDNSMNTVLRQVSLSLKSSKV